MKNKILNFVFALFLSSCIVQSPKYTTLEKVISLEIGMTKPEVEKKLGIEPYNISSYTDTSDTFIYVYRLKDRKTLSFNTTEVNGREVKGKYAQLSITYSKAGIVKSIESCSLCSDNLENTSKIDFGKIILFFTVTFPAILLYIGLKK